MVSRRFCCLFLGFLGLALVVGGLCIALIPPKEHHNELRHVIVLARHAERFPLISLPGMKYQPSVLTTRGFEQMRILGELLLERYRSYIPSVSDVHWVSTDDVRCLDSGRDILATLATNVTMFIKLPPLFQRGPQGFFDLIRPLYKYMGPVIPECIRLLVEKQEPTNSSADWITYISILVADGVDSLDRNATGLPTGLRFSDACVPLNRPVVPPEGFFNLTRAMRLWLMPVIDQVLLEMFPILQWDNAEQQHMLNPRAQVISTSGRRSTRSLSLYSVSDVQIELLVMCLRNNGVVMDRPLNGGHLILEIYGDNRIDTFFSSRWDAEAVKDLSLDPVTFAKRIIFCRYIIEPLP